MNGKPENQISDSARTAALLLSASEGNDAAFDELVNIYRPLLESSAAKYRDSVNDQDFEELTQEALLAFHSAVRTYDPLYGNVSFGSYAKVCVANGLVSAFRNICRSRSVNVVSLESDFDESLRSCDGPDSDYISRESAEEIRKLIRENLSSFENTVFWLSYSGMSAGDIAESVGKSEKSVTNALCRVRKKLRSLLK